MSYTFESIVNKSLKIPTGQGYCIVPPIRLVFPGVSQMSFGLTVNLIGIELPHVSVSFQPLLGDGETLGVVGIIWTGNVIGHDPTFTLFGRTKFAWK